VPFGSSTGLGLLFCGATSSMPPSNEQPAIIKATAPRALMPLMALMAAAANIFMLLLFISQNI
jgi:hypothetical protein